MDRNKRFVSDVVDTVMSSPARGTWIEISQQIEATGDKLVVPRKGDVDRNDVLVRLC